MSKPETRESLYLVDLMEKANVALWSNLLDAAAKLFEHDHSLRGDLAHSFSYFWSRRRRERREHISLDHTARLVSSFSADLRNLHQEISVVGHQSVTQFINRSTDKPQDHSSYSVYLLFLVGVAIMDGAEFSEHYTQQEIGQLRTLISDVVSAAVGRKRLSSILHSIQQFAANREARSETKQSFGGVAEFGKLSTHALWNKLFGIPPIEGDSYKNNPSIEKHYICYRYSTQNAHKAIVKTFLVFQSPSRIRDHFAFKNFYVSPGDVCRRSEGAIVDLGDKIALFGISRDEYMQKERNAEHPATPRGPKMLAFDTKLIGVRKPIFGGVLISVNERQETIASRVVCIEAKGTHSDAAGIGSCPSDKMNDELEKFTTFASDGPWKRSAQTQKRIWEVVLRHLAKPAKNGVLLGSDFYMDMREFSD